MTFLPGREKETSLFHLPPSLVNMFPALNSYSSVDCLLALAYCAHGHVLSLIDWDWNGWWISSQDVCFVLSGWCSVGSVGELETDGIPRMGCYNMSAPFCLGKTGWGLSNGLKASNFLGATKGRPSLWLTFIWKRCFQYWPHLLAFAVGYCYCRWNIALNESSMTKAAANYHQPLKFEWGLNESQHLWEHSVAILDTTFRMSEWFVSWNLDWFGLFEIYFIWSTWCSGMHSTNRSIGTLTISL